jgi:hypothetical protein
MILLFDFKGQKIILKMSECQYFYQTFKFG